MTTDPFWTWEFIQGQGWKRIACPIEPPNDIDDMSDWLKRQGYKSQHELTDDFLPGPDLPGAIQRGDPDFSGLGEVEPSGLRRATAREGQRGDDDAGCVRHFFRPGYRPIRAGTVRPSMAGQTDRNP